MSFWSKILRKDEGASKMRLPPPREPDPEIVASAMFTTRLLVRVDAETKRRQRLNLELSRAEDVIRGSRGSGTSG